MPEQSTPPTCVTCGRPRAGYGGGEPYCWMHSAGSGLALDAPPPAAAPSPSTVDAVARFFRALFGDEYDGSEEWDAHHDALNVLLAVVRREEQQKAAVEDERVRIRARDALAFALARAADSEMFLKRVENDYVAHLADARARAEQAEAQYAVAEAERVDSASLIQRVMKIVGDADGSGIETDEELLEALGRVEARVQGLTDALRGFVDVRPPSMEHPYAPTDYDEWRILRKDARAALAAKRVGRQNKRMKVESPAPAPRAHEENT